MKNNSKTARKQMKCEQCGILRLGESCILGIKVRNLVVLLLAMLIVSVISGLWIGWVQAFRVVFGSVFVLLLPGFVLSHWFFGGKELDPLERFALSFALSITVVPLIVFYLNIAGVKISVWLTIAVVLGVCLVSAIGILVKSSK